MSFQSPAPPSFNYSVNIYGTEEFCNFMLGVLLEPPKALLSTVQFVTIKIKDQVSESHNTTGEKGTRDNN
jgi:hypothetical protein